MQSVTLPSGLTSKQMIGDVEIRTYFLSCLAQTSYIIIHDKNAVLIDPRRDIDSYLTDLEGYELRAIFLTHIHADFVAGHKEVNIRTGAPIFLGPIDKSKVGFPFVEVKDCEHFVLSKKYNLRFIHSPGHTMESCVYLLEDNSAGKALAAFTGDTLFVGSVGRPDLVNEKEKTPQEMALLMYTTLFDKILSLPDDVIVYPAHGPGSPCGKAIQVDLWSTIGKQKVTNPALQFSGKVDEFVNFLCLEIGEVPAYFSQAVSTNLSGGEVLAEVMSKVSLLGPTEFAEKVKACNEIIIDTRFTTEYQKEHIPKSIHLYLGGEGGAKVSVTDGNFAMLLGYVLRGEERLALVAEEGKEAESVQRIARIGYAVSTCLKGGFKAWESAGLPTAVSEVRKRIKNEEDLKQLLSEGYVFVDVRFPPEYESNHLSQAKLNLPLHRIRDAASKLNKDSKYICYCKSGYRSSASVSLLEGMGFNVCDLFGGFAAISTYAVKQTTKGEYVPYLTDIMKELES